MNGGAPPPPGNNGVQRGGTETSASGGLSLSAVAEGAVVVTTLRNVGQKPLRVLSHVEAGELHYDWYLLTLHDASGNTRELIPVGDRDESYPVTKDLAPGATLEHRLDVPHWAAVEGRPLAPGAYDVDVMYEVRPDEDDDVWKGRLTAGPVKILVR